MQRRIVRSPDTEPLIRYDATMHDKPLFAPPQSPVFLRFRVRDQNDRVQTLRSGRPVICVMGTADRGATRA